MEKTALYIQTERSKVENDHLITEFVYEKPIVVRKSGKTHEVKIEKSVYTLQTDLKVPKVGLMMVGWGGNNGSTLTGCLLANKHKMSWATKRGKQGSNYFGSLLMASTMRLGIDETTNEEINIPMNEILPMVNPDDLVIGGWDISSVDLATAMDRAQVLEPSLKEQLYSQMRSMIPLPSIYYPDFIAANQKHRADNLIKSDLKREQLKVLRQNIKDFKSENNLDKVIIVWTANTERFAELLDGINDTGVNLLKSIEDNHSEISASTMFGVAAVLEKCPFINGSPQNTFVPGLIDLALENNVYIGGDDFKSGQTKLKSVLVDFLVNAGIKPVSITSYNHLGNNDGLNLSSHSQFRSKEISKKNVIDDMVESNRILYKENEMPDHVVVIKYVPAVGDSKRAIDEYECEIFMGGRKTISIHNVCEDSLLASPLILDLVLLTELVTRVQVKYNDNYENFHPILSVLSYMLKAPLSVGQAINSLNRQRNCIENFLRACVGLPPVNDLQFHKMLLS